MERQKAKHLRWLWLVIVAVFAAAQPFAQGVGSINTAKNESARSNSGGSSASFRRVLNKTAPKRVKPKPAPVAAKGKGKRPAAPKLDADDYFEQGEDFAQAKKYQEALANYRQALRLRPRFAAALYEIGWIYNDLERFNEALPPLEEALRYQANYPEVYNELGYAHRKLGKFSEAAENYRQAVAQRPDYALALFGLGDCYYYGTKEYKPALEAYQRGLRLDKAERPQVQFNTGWILNELERYPEAIGYLEKALQQQLERPETAYAELGYAFSKQGKNNEAIANYRRAMQVKPDYAPAFFGLGEVYFNAKQCADAAPVYVSGLRLDPQNALAQYRVGYCYNDIGKFAESIAPLREAIRLKPEYNAALIELGYSYNKLKQYANALGILNQALQNEPKNSLAYYYIGINYLDWGRRNEAIQTYRTLQSIDKNRAQQLLDAINKR